MTEEAPELETAGEDVTALNDQLLDSLRLLNYEKDYVQKGGKAVMAGSFANSINPSEQFNNFKNLVKYLFRVNDISASDFSNYDDPMTVSTNILNECKKIGIPSEFPPLKLKSGAGQHVLIVLTQLATKALKRKNFAFKRPKYEEAGREEEQAQEDGKGGDDNDDMIDEAEMGSEEEMEERQQMGVVAMDQDKQIIHSAVNENDWKLECQRVANKLKIQSKADTKQWRAHIDSTKTCTDLVRKNFPNTRVVLEKLNDDLGRTLQKIEKSERMINNNMSDTGEQYKNQSEQLKKLSTHYNNLSASLKEMNQNYRVINEKLQQIQAKTNEHSGTMTDNSPVAKIKEALNKITVEIKTMDVRMGVLSHTILQYKAKEKAGDKKNYKHMDMEDLYDLQ